MKEICKGISSRLQPSIAKNSLVGDRIMQLRLKHSLHSISVVVVYAPTEICETEEKEGFYGKFDSVLDQCPYCGALEIV